jgi:acyl-coenzyme A synthetase/AMP-(fatty) acid ligase
MKWGITELQAVDDVVIVSGHNLGTAPIEDALTSIRQLLSQQL